MKVQVEMGIPTICQPDPNDDHSQNLLLGTETDAHFMVDGKPSFKNVVSEVNKARKAGKL